MLLRVVVLILGASVAHCLKDLVDTTAAAQNASTFSGYITKSGVASTLKAPGPFTFLVPVNSAWDAIPKADLASLVADNTALANMVKYHTILGETFSYEVTNGLMLISVSGHAIRVYRKGDDIFFNNAKAVKVDLEAENGVIYFLDTVLDVPEGSIYDVISKPEYNLTIFKSAVDKIHYSSLLSHTYASSAYRYTVLVPSDAAFAKLDKLHIDRILKSSSFANQLVRYHIHRGTIHLKSLDHKGRMSTLLSGHDIGVDVDNNDIRFNRLAHLDRSDIECDNGVVHIIDHVLFPSTLSGQIIG